MRKATSRWPFSFVSLQNMWSAKRRATISRRVTLKKREMSRCEHHSLMRVLADSLMTLQQMEKRWRATHWTICRTRTPFKCENYHTASIGRVLPSFSEFLRIWIHGAGAINMYCKTTRNTSSHQRTTTSRSLMAKQSPGTGVDAVAETFNLTPAEIRTLERLLGGSSPAEIADELGVALPTVRTHLSNIFAKTGTARQLELVLMAAELTTPNRRSQGGV